MTRLHWSVGIGLLGALLIALAAFWGRTEQLKPARRISLQRSVVDSAGFASSTDKLKFAVGAIISPAESLTFYQDIFDYIAEKLGRGIEMVQRKTYAEVNFLMKEGRIDAAFVCSRPYVEGHRDFGMELLCAPVCFGKTEYYCYIIVPKDSSVEKLQDLRGKVFAFSDPLSNTGALIPTYILAKMAETPESFFSRYIFTYSHDNSIHSVADKFVDGAAVDSLIWEYENVKDPGWTSRTRIIYRSAPCGIPPVVVSPSIDQQLKDKLRSTFLNMHKDRRGRLILKRVLIDRFTLIEDNAYDSIRQMEDFVKDFRRRK